MNAINAMLVMKLNKTFYIHKRRGLKLMPYVGCKAGFSNIFDEIIPDHVGKIYDLFGGGGGFSFYASRRFGSDNIVYNDHNPAICNLIKSLQRYPNDLYNSYEVHRNKSSHDYYNNCRKQNVTNNTDGAARLLYLAKNAFSGKIRWNKSGQFNTPMRKNTKCPKIKLELLINLSNTIKNMAILNDEFNNYDMKNSLVYLDPPYIGNKNSHYDATSVKLQDFNSFVRKIEKNNKVVISEQNTAESLGLPDYNNYDVILRRSLQYHTTKLKETREVLLTNYTGDE